MKRFTRVRIGIVGAATLCAALGLLWCLDAPGARIEAIQGKRYRLTRQHGPWMIMVATFHEPPADRKGEGMTPIEAADELVYALRKKGIPAYTFTQKDVRDQLSTTDRQGRARMRTYTAQRGSVCVLAGNYNGPDDRVAQGTLKYIKRFHPKFLRSVTREQKLSAGILRKLSSGGIYRGTPGKPSPLSGAMLTINPVLTPEEASRRQRDPMLLKLNSGMEFSLLDNPGRYTLIVASSYVKSPTATTGTDLRSKASAFEVTEELDQAYLNAWQLARTLREGTVPFRTSRGVVQRNFEAYVFHDRFRSIVTVGSFNSPNDPRIKEFQQIFGAKVRPHPQTKRDVLIAEVITLPDPKNPKNSVNSWIFDPQPRLIQVPRLK